jgi:hypothetical protein
MKIIKAQPVLSCEYVSYKEWFQTHSFRKVTFIGPVDIYEQLTMDRALVEASARV